jgi:hypothetical protein
MESWNGYVDSTNDALLLFEACRLGILPKVERRLSEEERTTLVRNGATFVWDEEESGVRRWTDGRVWGASRISGSFLVYKEVSRKKKDSGFVGLIKKAISIYTADGRKQHLISYYTAEGQAGLPTPSTHALFKDIIIPCEQYPEFVAEANADAIAGIVMNVGGVSTLLPAQPGKSPLESLTSLPYAPTLPTYTSSLPTRPVLPTSNLPSTSSMILLTSPVTIPPSSKPLLGYNALYTAGTLSPTVYTQPSFKYLDAFASQHPNAVSHTSPALSVSLPDETHPIGSTRHHYTTLEDLPKHPNAAEPAQLERKDSAEDQFREFLNAGSPSTLGS